MKKLLLLILLLALVGVVNAADCLDETGCSLDGNHYSCTGTFTNCDGFVSTDYSIYIYDAIISQTGGIGGTSLPGEDGSVIISSPDKVKLENVAITSVGGPGGPGDDDDNNIANGGTGGIAGLNITSPYVYFDGVSVTATGGLGGLGAASASLFYISGELLDCEGADEADGGYGGAIYIDINAETSFTSYNVNYTLTSGAGGNGDSDACIDEEPDNEECKGAEGQAGWGGIIYFNVDTNISDINNNDITGIGGIAGSPSGDVMCVSWSDDDDDGDGVTVMGGRGGSMVLDINAINMTVDDLNIDVTGGASTNSYVEVQATSSGDGAYEIAEAEDGQSGGTMYTTLEADYLYLSNLNIDVQGTDGSMADADRDTDGDTSADKERATGGQGSHIYVYLYADEEGTLDDTTILSTAGLGGHGDGAGTGTYDYDGTGGNGGNTILYIKNMTTSNLTYTGIGGSGYVADGDGKGGLGGTNYLYLYGDTYFDDSTIQMTPGVGGAGQSVDCGYFGCGGGSGGSAYLYNYGDAEFVGSFINATGAPGGVGTQCNDKSYSPLSATLGIGGMSKILNTGEITFSSNTEVIMYGGVGSCNVGGDAEINSTISLAFTDTYIDMTMGDSVSSTHGNCNIFLNGDFSSEDTNITCVSDDGLGVASIIGTNLDQFDYRQGTNITFSGATNVVNLTFDGATQKFLTWDTTAPDTYVYWDCGVAKYGNRTPSSDVSLTFNDTCTELGYDAYSTDLNSLVQGYLEGVTVKSRPYSYVNYTCTATATFPTDIIQTIKANFTWYVNGSATSYDETNAVLVSGVPYTSTAILDSSEVVIDANVSCKVDLLSAPASPPNDLMFTEWVNETVIPAYHYNLMIDIGNNSVVDYTGSGDFSGVFTQTEADGAGLNSYLRDCDDTTCVIPIRFYSDEDSKIIINEIKGYYGVDSVENDNYNVSLDIFSSEAGTLAVDEVELSYDFGDGDTVNITAEVIGPTETNSESFLVTIVESIFDAVFPSGISFMELYPTSPTDKDVEPVGQTSTIPIFNITNNHTTEDIDVYIKLQYSWASMGLPCSELELSLDNIASGGPNITTTSTIICNDLGPGESCGIWGFQDFSCTWNQLSNAYYEPTFLFDSMCSDCVLTYDYLDD